MSLKRSTTQAFSCGFKREKKTALLLSGGFIVKRDNILGIMVVKSI